MSGFGKFKGQVWMPLVGFWWVFGTSLGHAQTFGANLTDATWVAQSGPFACTLVHKIPGFGTGTFARQAGAAEHFVLAQDKAVLPAGTVNINAVPPPWRSDIDPLPLGQAQAVAGKTPVTLAQGRLPALVAGLDKDLQVMFSSSQISDDGTSVQVALAPRNFAAAYNTYRTCIAQLIPYNFQQLARSVIHYAPKGEQLNAAAKAQLDKVVRYTKADASVLGIIIDAHSDKLADPAQGDAIARVQADLVTQYLVDKGLPADKITARTHGDKFPIASNATEKGKAQNRRVTVRLENEKTRQATEQKVAALKQKSAAAASAQSVPASSAPAAAPANQIEAMTEAQDLTSGFQPNSLDQSGTVKSAGQVHSAGAGQSPSSIPAPDASHSNSANHSLPAK